MYLASKIDAALELAKADIFKCLPYHRVVSCLNAAFSDKSLKFHYEKYDQIDKNDYSIGGLYDMEENVRYIILNLSSKSNTLEVNPDNWIDLKFFLSQTIQHESIHQIQWTNRNFSDSETTLDFRSMGSLDWTADDKFYLADKDEIEAYAHDIAMEIKHNYPHRDPVDVLQHIGSTRKVWSYNCYRRTFKTDDWTKIRTHLLRKAYKWIMVDSN